MMINFKEVFPQVLIIYIFCQIRPIVLDPVLLSVEANPENSLKVVHGTEIDDFYFSWRPNHFSEKLRCLQFM